MKLLSPAKAYAHSSIARHPVPTGVNGIEYALPTHIKPYTPFLNFPWSDPVQLSLVDPVPGAVCLPCMAQRDILDQNPGMARVFDAVFLDFCNDAFSSPRRVISHILPFCLVSVVLISDTAVTV